MKKLEINRILEEEYILLAGIYFISQNSEFVKIGETGNLRFRFEAFTVYNPHKCHIIGFIYITDRKERLIIEKRLHEKFKHLHKKGEWYYLTDEIVKAIEKYEWIFPDK